METIFKIVASDFENMKKKKNFLRGKEFPQVRREEFLLLLNNQG